jgi:hypothetical protein
MPRAASFLDMTTAPKDGTVIEVRHGPDQEVIRAEWSDQNQGWIRANDPHRKTLHRVTGWRPVK